MSLSKREFECTLNWYDGQIKQAKDNKHRFLEEYNIEAAKEELKKEVGNPSSATREKLQKWIKNKELLEAKAAYLGSDWLTDEQLLCTEDQIRQLTEELENE